MAFISGHHHKNLKIPINETIENCIKSRSSKDQWVNEIHHFQWKVTFPVNTLWPRQNGSHFTDDIFKCIFLNENGWISNKISLKFVPKGPINNIPALVQIMAWRRPGNKPLSELMLVSLLTHICVTRPQWVNKTLHHKSFHKSFLSEWNRNN